jgi:hypothetical protein
MDSEPDPIRGGRTKIRSAGSDQKSPDLTIRVLILTGSDQNILIRMYQNKKVQIWQELTKQFLIRLDSNEKPLFERIRINVPDPTDPTKKDRI